MWLFSALEGAEQDGMREDVSDPKPPAGQKRRETLALGQRCRWQRHRETRPWLWSWGWVEAGEAEERESKAQVALSRLSTGARL